MRFRVWCKGVRCDEGVVTRSEGRLEGNGLRVKELRAYDRHPEEITISKIQKVHKNKTHLE